MGLFGGGRGGWSTKCEQDPRFNLEGRASGMCSTEEAITKAILAKQKRLRLTDAELDALTIETFFCKD